MEKTDNIEVTLGMAEIKVGKAPLLIRTHLGSCLAVCLYSVCHKVGGMLHLMLPDSRDAFKKIEFKKAKFADTGIEELLFQLHSNFGVVNKHLTAKIFGAASVLKNVSCQIGRDNEKAVRDILRNLNIDIIAAKTGGEKGYKVLMDFDTGKVSCQIFGEKVEVF